MEMRVSGGGESCPTGAVHPNKSPMAGAGVPPSSSGDWNCDTLTLGSPASCGCCCISFLRIVLVACTAPPHPSPTFFLHSTHCPLQPFHMARPFRGPLETISKDSHTYSLIYGFYYYYCFLPAKASSEKRVLRQHRLSPVTNRPLHPSKLFLGFPKESLLVAFCFFTKL